MNALDEVLKQYEQPERVVLSQTEQEQLSEEASTHLHNYLCGDGDIRHLHNYYDSLEKIS